MCVSRLVAATTRWPVIIRTHVTTSGAGPGHHHCQWQPSERAAQASGPKNVRIARIVGPCVRSKVPEGSSGYISGEDNNNNKASHRWSAGNGRHEAVTATTGHDRRICGTLQQFDHCAARESRIGRKRPWLCPANGDCTGSKLRAKPANLTSPLVVRIVLVHPPPRRKFKGSNSTGTRSITVVASAPPLAYRHIAAVWHDRVHLSCAFDTTK